MDTNEDTTAPSFSQRYDRAIDRLRAIRGIGFVLAADTNQDDANQAVAHHIGELARDAMDELELMWAVHREEYDKKVDPANEPGAWTGATAEVETKALMRRIFALPERSVRQLMDFCLTVVTAHNAEKPSTVTLEEIASMLERGATAASVQSFWHLKHQGLAQLVERKAPDEIEPLHAQ